ncbi:hypothetical protein MMC28_010673 [Mycoblastus sanguinarius]|nr:hypothetical protein [Mycoblastus sanguinarius]
MHISNNTSFIKNILFLSLLIEIAICAPANPVDSIAISSSNAGNNLLLNPVPSASLNVSGASNGNCASAPKFSTWQAPGWNTEDCYSAVQQMYLKEVYTHPDADYEFVAQGASSTRPDLPVEKTPRKYTVTGMPGTYLPGGTSGVNFPSTDVSTYQKIFTAAKNIESACTLTRMPGWLPVGDSFAMGVFVWATNSHMNQITGGYPAMLSPPNLNTSESEALNMLEPS